MLTPFKLIIPANFANVDQSFDINDLGPALSLRTTVDCSKLRAQNSGPKMFLNHHAGWFFPTVLFQGFVFRQALKNPHKNEQKSSPNKKNTELQKTSLPKPKDVIGRFSSLLDGPVVVWEVRLAECCKGTSSPTGWSEVKGGFTVTTPGLPVTYLEDHPS